MGDGLGDEESDIPEKYGVTLLYVHLRLTERLRWLTPERLARMTPQMLRVLEGFERLRQHEEAMMAQIARM